jgi:hypothetical protein
MNEQRLIGELITNGHAQDFAEEVARFARSGRRDSHSGHLWAHAMWCHTVRYSPADGTFTYLGR